MSQTAKQIKNPGYNILPFRSDDLVVLKRDCQSYTFFKNFEERFLKKGRFSLVVECGYGYIYVNSNQENIGFVDDNQCEWCSIDIITKESDYDDEELENKFPDEDFLVPVMVKIEDLRLANENDVRLSLRSKERGVL